MSNNITTSNNNNDNGDSTCCQVCTDPAAAFYCGAQVCEACKKFFIRSWKNSTENNYVCLQDRKCVLTKESRKHCAYCRYDRCLQLKMYLPGGPRVSQEISQVPCRICGAPSSGFHFGAITCEGCKGFFRRRCHDNRFDKFKCNENNCCVISAANRSMCRACRLRKCLDSGMVAEKCRIGRQPNIVIHKTKLEMQKILNESLINNNNKDYFPTSKSSEGSAALPSKFTPTTSTNALINHRQDSLKVENSSHYILNDNVHSNVAHDNTFDCNNKYVTGPVACDNLCTLQSQYTSKHVSKLKRFIMNKQVCRHSNVFSNTCTEPDQCNYFYDCHQQKNNSATVDRPEIGSKDAFDYADSIQAEIPSSFSSTNITSLRSPHRPRALFSVAHAETALQTSLISPGIPEELPVVKIEQDNNNNTDSNDVYSYKYLSKTIFGRSINDIIDIIGNAFNCLIPIITRHEEQTVNDDMSRLEVWQRAMKRFEVNARASLAFARKVPGFKVLPLSSQIELIQYSMFPVILGTMSLAYDHVIKLVNFFMWDNKEKELILTNFSFFKFIETAIMNIGDIVKTLKIDNIELSFVLSIFLLSTSNNFEYKELLIDALKFYVTSTFGRDSQRHNQILMTLRALVMANQNHKEMIVHVRNLKLPIPQLFEETFMSDTTSFGV